MIFPSNIEEWLKSLASRQTLREIIAERYPQSPFEEEISNFEDTINDAYYRGYEDGQTDLSRDMLYE